MKRKNYLESKAYTIGRIGEKLALNKFQELGINFQCNIDEKYSHDFDFLVNGKRVEVKTAKASYYNFPEKYKYGHWIFNYTKEKGKFDYLVCIGKTEGKIIFLVIPAKEIKGEKAIAMYPFSITKNWKYYSKFINKWNLLIDK